MHIPPVCFAPQVEQQFFRVSLRRPRDVTELRTISFPNPAIESLQTSFSKAGYKTLGAGKLFHHPIGLIDQRGWTEFYLRNPEQRKNGWPLDSWSAETPFPKKFPASIYNKGQEIKGGLFLEWAAIPNELEEQMADTKPSQLDRQAASEETRPAFLFGVWNLRSTFSKLLSAKIF